MSAAHEPAKSRSTERWQRREAYIKRFEAAWLAGQRPALDDYLPADPTDRRAVLVELVYADLECRLGAGEGVPVETYFQRYPELAADPEVRRELLAAANELRREAADRTRGSTGNGTVSQPAGGETGEAPTLPPPPSAETDPFATRKTPAPPADISWAARQDALHIPGYELLGELGRGGMGVVYKARQVQLKRVVALKMILSGSYAGEAEVARFKSEAEAVARLQHPNIVQIYEIGEAEGRPFFSLEYVEGGSLDKKLGGTPLPAPQAAQLVERLARAINAAHQRGIIHRDLKPANILLASGGGEPSGAHPSGDSHPPLAEYVPKITDFGLAKQLDAAQGQTQSGAILGTPSYMAPEQAGGPSKEIGPATDVYALGAILYELLTGRPPFKAATPLDTLLQVVSEEPVPPWRLQAKVPKDLETICLKCLEKQPGKRYSSALLLGDELGRFLNNEPIQARPVGRWERGWKWAKRRPALASLLAVSVLALVALAVLAVGLFYNARLQEGNDQLQAALLDARQQRQQAQNLHQEAEKQRSEAREQARLARRYRYIADLNLAQRHWEGADIGRMRELLEEYRPKQSGRSAEEDVRDFEWYYLWRLCEAEPLTLKGHTDTVTGVAFAPNCRRVATASEDGTAKVWDLQSGKELLSLKVNHDSVYGVAFAPNGRRLATASWNGTKVLDAATGKELLTLKGHTANVYGVAFSPNGRRLATASRDKTAKVWDAQSGKEILTLKGHTAAVMGVAFSPNGRRLATTSRDNTAKVWDAQSGKELLTLKGHTDTGRGVAFAPNGRRLATASWDGTAKVWDAQSGKELLTLKGHTAALSGVAFSPNGRRLATASGDKTAKVWDAQSGKELLTLKGHDSWVSGVAFSPNGRLATASDDRTAKVWDAQSGKELLTLQGHAQSAHGVAFSPNGRRLATASVDQTAKVWDARTGKELLTLKGHTASVNGVAFAPNGRRLATASQDKTAKVWDAQSGKELLSVKGHTGYLYGVAFAPNGRRLATASRDNTAKVWDAQSGKELLSLKGHTRSRGVYGVAFAPNGGRLATASDDRTAKVWDAASGKELLTLKGHTDAVFGVAFAPNGRRLATTSLYETKVWDAQTGKELLTLKGGTSSLNSVAFAPNCRRLAIASGDQTATVWIAAENGE